MSLKQINPPDRIIFLKKFIAELMINSEEQKPFKKIEIEKIKQRFLQPIDTPEKAFKKAINTDFFPKPIYSKGIKSGPRVRVMKRPLLHRMRIPRRPLQIKKLIAKKPIEQALQISPSPQIQVLQSIKPEPQQRPEGFGLGKLEPLIRDASIQSIECPGSGKNVLIKKYNKINVTQIILSQAEISTVINDFSEKARIPIVGGILKAAVGDLVISAVISEFVGSRFIINKITPYSLIEK